MGLFDKLKALSMEAPSKADITIMAPVSGEIVNIESVPEDFFSEKIGGDGVAIKPAEGKVVAPADGTIECIFDGNNAFTLASGGLELFVHIGIGTDEFNGEGFKRIADAGQAVKAGDTIIEFNLALLEEKATSILTPIIISNMDKIIELRKMTGAVIAGESPILGITK